MHDLVMDARLALRGFRRARTWSAAAILTLAIGIGTTTAVFALLNAVLLRPLPVASPDELVTLELLRERRGGMPLFTYPQYETLREHRRGLADVMATSVTEYGIAVPGEDPRIVPAWEVSGNYFAVLGVRPALGRFFTPAEVDVPGGAPVAVVSHDFWRTHLGGGSDALGRSLYVNGRELVVVGVAPAGYRGTVPAAGAQLWLPLTLVPTLRPGTGISRPGGAHWLTLIARLEPGTARPQAEARLSTVARSLAGDAAMAASTAGGIDRGEATGVTLHRLRALPAFVVGPAAAFLALLLATAGMVLLIASVNVTSMALARSTARARELAVRRSLGATRGRLVRQLLTENVLLFLCGAAGGMLIAVWTATSLPLLAERLPFPVVLDVPLDWRVFGFALLVACGAGALFGLAPALHATDAALMQAVRDGAASRRPTRLRSAFVVAQLSISLVLLVLGGLLGRALQNGLVADPGFDARGVAVAGIDLRPYGYDAERAHAFVTQLTARLATRGDVTASGASAIQPLLGFATTDVRREGEDDAAARRVYYNIVDDGFIATLQVPLRRGRGFDERDRHGAPRVAIVNETFARLFWPGEDPIGKRIHAARDESAGAIEVVGVVAAGRYGSLTEEPQPFFMMPLAQSRRTSAYVYARGAGGTARLETALREEASALDPVVPTTTSSLAAAIGTLLLPQRVASAAIGVFGVIGLLLAGIGLYGVVAFTVAQRTREIGVRMALGAGAGEVIRLFLVQGARLLGIAGIVGIALALAAGHALSALLFGVSPRDPLTFMAVALLLGGVALLATYVPARRASRVDPMAVLRGE
jgi:predicted permease